ncbi:MAG: putative zinc-binding protein [Desulforhopalus sp.]
MSSTPTSCGCSCSSGPNLIFSCSGAADVGELADRAARKLTKTGMGKMFCLAGIVGRVSGLVTATEAASPILTIYGCAQECARSHWKLQVLKKVNHLILSDHGFEKGHTEVTQESIDNVIGQARKVL